MSIKTALRDEARAIRNEDEVVPNSLKEYIENELKEKIKEKCKSEYCQRMCDGEIGTLVNLINRKLKLKRREELENICEGLDENGNIIKQENEEATKQYIERIISRIWDEREVIEYIGQFFQNVIYWKKQALLREDAEPGEIDTSSNELKDFFEKIIAEVEKRVNTIGEEEKEQIKRRLMDAYKKYKKSLEKRQRRAAKSVNPGEAKGENDSDDRDDRDDRDEL